MARRLMSVALALLLVASLVSVAAIQTARAHGTVIYVSSHCLAYVSYSRWGYPINAYQNFYYADGHVDYVGVWINGCPT
jgi:hypothetical protein